MNRIPWCPFERGPMFFRLKKSGERSYIQIVENKRVDGAVHQSVICGRPPMASTFWRFERFDRLRSYVRPHMRALASSYFFISTFLGVCHYGAVDLIDQGGALITTGLPCKPHIRRDLRPHHGPAFGTGELQEGGATL